MILLITDPNEPQSAELLRELGRRGAETVVFDYAWYPSRAAIDIEHTQHGQRCSLRLDGGAPVALDRATTIWWGRPRAVEPPATVTRERDRRFVMTESMELIGGLCQCLSARWVNHPVNDETASRKPFQLQVAREVGLRIPRTLMTNDPASAADFVARTRAIYKTFVATEDVWRLTRMVGPAELRELEAVRHAPVIFQEYVPAAADVRIIMAGASCLAAAFDASEARYPLDYRADLGGAKARPIDLPVDTKERLMALMGRLGLEYGAIDMRLTHEGELVFLEINPCGQWLYVEEATGQPMTSLVADALLEVGP